MRLHVIYRSVGHENLKGRPSWFDKRVGMASLLRAAAEATVADLTFVNDGPIPEDRTELMAGAGRVIQLDAAGNSGSYRIALRAALDSTWPDEDLVYLCEDDYVHAVSALHCLYGAARDLTSPAYFTLYDHPDLYDRHARSQSTVAFAASRHWRQVPSTCMTFAARLGALRRDRRIHWAGTIPNTPRDQRIWQATLRTGPLALLPRRRSGPMVSPMPSLATHAEADQLAPGVDWEEVAADARLWAWENH